MIFFFFIVTTTKQLFRPCSSCFFLGSVHVPDGCSWSGRSENHQLALRPRPVGEAPPEKEGVQGQGAKKLLSREAPWHFVLVSVLWGTFVFFGRVFFNVLAYFIRKGFLLTWPTVLICWTELSARTLWFSPHAAQLWSIVGKLWFGLVGINAFPGIVSAVLFSFFFYFLFSSNDFQKLDF